MQEFQLPRSDPSALIRSMCIHQIHVHSSVQAQSASMKLNPNETGIAPRKTAGDNKEAKWSSLISSSSSLGPSNALRSPIAFRPNRFAHARPHPEADADADADADAEADPDADPLYSDPPGGRRKNKYGTNRNNGERTATHFGGIGRRR
ncbi:unnamed protein product [Darwinula stevensoni]|uniref:Uncharacterized protein n=1 Tax=Darwinula stevensoni TaxID=69355 RepID=A0A7R9AFL6_9CRUS|nr:unnamed protein product [Darwinula stevensoni]CAG0903167.1 unnamed protein product [Darwinula stevensoni]